MLGVWIMRIERIFIYQLAIALVGGSLEAQPGEVRNPHTSAADVAAGAKIFRGHCGECHGLNGEGGRGPALTSGVFYHGGSDAELLETISEGIPGTSMPGVFFSPDQVWQVVAYVRTLSQSRRAPPSGDAARGARLFREKGCLGCHIALGEGGTNGPDLTLIGSQRSGEHLRQAIVAPSEKVLRPFWQAKITMENGTAYNGFVLNEGTYTVQMLDTGRGLVSVAKRDFNRFEIERTSSMPSYAGKLSPQELDDLVGYLSSLQRKGGNR
jgi:putative heme-binding domain-containing protein